MKSIGFSYGRRVRSRIAVIGTKYYRYPWTPITLIACKYESIPASRPSICSAVSGVSPWNFWSKPPTGAANKNLLDFDIAGARVHVQQHAAISHLALDMVAGQGALHCDRMVDLQGS